MARVTYILLLAFAGLTFPLLQTRGQPRVASVPQAPISSPNNNQSQHDGYVGDAVCVSCHQVQGTYQHTSHFLTSSLGSKDSILGSFLAGSDVLMIADPAKATDDPGLYFKMEAKSDGFYQTAVAGWPDRLEKRSERMDIVIGSGVRGQTYLYWHGDQLYELPVSYWSDGQRWINSPGYKNGTMNFTRPITPRCLECHATYIKPLSLNPLANRFYKDSLVPGISCEKCHGPGRDHIQAKQAKVSAPAGSTTGVILNPAKFSRDRQVDMCALCHNGVRSEEIAPAFSFVPGKSLDDYLQPNSSEVVAHPDVHGNQVGLLKRSQCYLSSPNMSCSTCHDVHAPERSAESYSSRCLTCHQVENCGMSKTMGRKIVDGCIGCHMPLEQTAALDFDTGGQVVRPKMRNHWIKIYPQNAGVPNVH